MAPGIQKHLHLQQAERYMKLKTKLHARLPIEMENKVGIGDFIQIRECRPLSKIIHFIVVKKIRDASENKNHVKKEVKIEEITK